MNIGFSIFFTATVHFEMKLVSQAAEKKRTEKEKKVLNSRPFAILSFDMLSVSIE